MQVAGADTAERNAHNGIARALQLGLRLIDQLELAAGYVGVGEHNNLFKRNYFFCFLVFTHIIVANIFSPLAVSAHISPLNVGEDFITP